MSSLWLVVLVVGVATVALKATGPVLLGGRKLPAAVAGVVELLAPVLLTALVVTQTVGGDNELVLGGGRDRGPCATACGGRRRRGRDGRREGARLSGSRPAAGVDSRHRTGPTRHRENAGFRRRYR
jgi:hypothetical protein